MRTFLRALGRLIGFTLLFAVTLSLYFLPFKLVFGEDVTIKGVPEGAVVEVKKLSAVAVERYFLAETYSRSKEKIDKFNADLETFLKANDLLVEPK